MHKQTGRKPALPHSPRERASQGVVPCSGEREVACVMPRVHLHLLLPRSPPPPAFPDIPLPSFEHIRPCTLIEVQHRRPTKFSTVPDWTASQQGSAASVTRSVRPRGGSRHRAFSAPLVHHTPLSEPSLKELHTRRAPLGLRKRNGDRTERCHRRARVFDHAGWGK